jgi:hypothetical protein
MKDKQYETIERYKRHRERLLLEIAEFADALGAADRRLMTDLNAYTAHRSIRDAKLRTRRRREYIDFLVRSDDDLAAFQKRWRVVLFASKQARIRLCFVDDFFLVPVAPYANVRTLEDSRLLVVERAAGRAAVFEALDQRLDLRSPGEVSRLPSDPPWELVDTRGERDFSKEDPIAVKICKNGIRPNDYAQRIAARAYEKLAERLGYREGIRLPPHGPGNRDVDLWDRVTKGIRHRWPKLDRTLGPFAV